MSTRAGLPGLSHVDHVAFTVPDLDEAVRFFVDVLGCEELYRSSRGGDREFMVRNFEVDPEASFTLSMLRMAPTLNVELFAWNAPDQRSTPPRHCDLGGHHLCVYVDDVDAAAAYLAARPGVRVMGPTKTVAGDGPVTGTRWTYATTSWGLLIELVNRSAVRHPPAFVGPAGPIAPGPAMGSRAES